MPKVSQEHLDARRRQILTAAVACFSRRGFHQATMQDIVREAGLSPGAVYRYFSSKEELVAAISDQALRTIDSVLLTPEGEPPPLEEMVSALLGAFDRMDLPEDRRRLAVQIWAEATLNPYVGEFVRGALVRARSAIVARVRADQERGEVDPAVDPEGVARVMIALFQGFTLQYALGEDLDREVLTRTGRTMLDGLLRPASAPAGP